MPFLAEFQTATIAFRDAVLLQDFTLAQQRLDTLSKLVAKNWERLTPQQRDNLHAEFMVSLQWARTAVTMNRDQLRADFERIESSKVYQMPDPRIRWNVEG